MEQSYCYNCKEIRRTILKTKTIENWTETDAYCFVCNRFLFGLKLPRCFGCNKGVFKIDIAKDFGIGKGVICKECIGNY